MGKNKDWNRGDTWTNGREKKKRDPLYQCNYDVMYTQEIILGTMALIDSIPVRADKNGIMHGVKI
jgi:hypothetical protein